MYVRFARRRGPGKGDAMADITIADLLECDVGSSGLSHSRSTASRHLPSRRTGANEGHTLGGHDVSSSAHSRRLRRGVRGAAMSAEHSTSRRRVGTAAQLGTAALMFLTVVGCGNQDGPVIQTPTSSTSTTTSPPPTSAPSTTTTGPTTTSDPCCSPTSPPPPPEPFPTEDSG